MRAERMAESELLEVSEMRTSELQEANTKPRRRSTFVDRLRILLTRYQRLDERGSDFNLQRIGNTAEMRFRTSNFAIQVFRFPMNAIELQMLWLESKWRSDLASCGHASEYLRMISVSRFAIGMRILWPASSVVRKLIEMLIGCLQGEGS